jgi:hypothetical protein
LPAQLELINAYNHHLSQSRRSIPPDLLFRNTLNPTIIWGNLNIHNICTDPLRSSNRREENLSSLYFTAAAAHSYSLLNIPGRFTRISPNPLQRHGVIDLAFANPPALNLFLSRG